MVLDNLLGKKSNEIEEYVELEFEEDGSADKKLVVKVEKLNSYSDSERVQEKIRDGTILLVDIRGLKNSDMGELKRAVSRIRKTCMAVNGDIAGVGDNWLIITPKHAVIHRERE